MPGIFKTSLPGAEKTDTLDAIGVAAAGGFDALMLGSLYDLSTTLDPGEMAAVVQAGREQGVTIAAGLGGFHPLRHERCADVVRAGDGDLVAGAVRLARLGVELGLSELFFAVGMITDREDGTMPWATQLDAVEAGLKAIAPALRDLGTRVLIKTHEEITTEEILRLIEQVGEDVLGVAHDPVNVVCRLEDPVEATRRVAPYVRQVHLDDAVLQLDGSTVRRYLVPMGTGDLDWPSILRQVPGALIWLETHRGQFAMDCFNPEWLAKQTNANLTEYAWIVGTAVRRGNGPAPWDQGDPLGRVPSMLDWVSRQIRE